MKIRPLVKIISINLLLFFILIIIFESIFGYWFKENNLGYIVRSDRQKKVLYETIHNGEKYKFFYKRNFYGFRGEEADPKDIKIVFHG